MGGSDPRCSERVPVDSVVGLARPDEEGGKSITVGRCTNRSEFGIQVVVPQPIAVNSFIEFQVREPQVQGSGTVRYCKPAPGGYAVGILFGDHRASLRKPVDSSVRLATPDGDGILAIEAGWCTNESDSGIQVIVPEPITVNSFVEFKVHEPKIHGTGTVRYCRKTASGWAVGIHFSGGIKPKDPQG